MSKVVLASCILCLCLMNVNLVATVHAEDLPVTKTSPDMQSKQTKSIIIDGVEYVPKSSVKGRKKTKTKSANSIKIGGVEYVPKPIDNSAQKKNDAELKSEPKQTVSETMQSSSPSPGIINENKSLEPKENKPEPKQAGSIPANNIKQNNGAKSAKQSKSSSIQASPNSGNAINEDLEKFAMKGKFGAGIEASVVNLGIGPTAEYWITDNIVASGHLGLGTFTTYGIRGDYVFSKQLNLFRGYMAEPYAGLGYTFIKGPEESGPGYKVT